MTLQELINTLSANPIYVLFYFLIIPFAAFLAGVLGKEEGHLVPWNYLYSTLIYLVSVPGIFVLMLNIYLFLFEKRSIMETDLLTQVLPIGSMIFTLLLIKRNVDLDLVPGFDKLSGLMVMITAILGVMWIVDRTRLLVFSYIRIEFVLLIFVALLLLIRFGWKRLFASSVN